MQDDATLLRRYAEEKSEAAFTELVHRHVDLVYSSALRRTGGDAEAAHDVVQRVFATLARDATRLARHTVLTAWLYTTTRNAAIDHLRGEQRRRTREATAQALHDLNSNPTPTANWESLRPVLDRVMDELPDADRVAVLLRFFEKRTFAEIRIALNVSEDAARMRTERALEKLRVLLTRRGITSTATALGALLAAQGIVAAPAGLAAGIAGSVVSGAAAVGAATGSIALVSSPNFSATIAVVAAIIAIGVAWQEGQAEQSQLAGLAAARAEQAVLLAQVKGLGEKMAAQTRQAAVPAIRFSTAAVAAQPAEEADDPTEAGRAFLARYPEAQATLDAMRLEMFERNWGDPLRRLGLAPAERAALEREIARVVPSTFRITARGWAVGAGTDMADPRQHTERIAQEILARVGEERFRDAFAFKPLDVLLKNVAVASHETGDALTREQIGALAAAIERHGARRVAVVKGGPFPDATSMSLQAVDWDALGRELTGTLTPAQIAALNAARGSGAAQQREQSASMKFLTPTPTGVKPGGQ